MLLINDLQLCLEPSVKEKVPDLVKSPRCVVGWVGFGLQPREVSVLFTLLFLEVISVPPPPPPDVPGFINELHHDHVFSYCCYVSFRLFLLLILLLIIISSSL